MKKESWLDRVRYSTAYAEMMAKRHANRELPSPRLFNGWFAYNLLKMLNTDFTEWEAYKLGIIDENGIEQNKPSTKKERAAWNYYKKLVASLKRRLERVVPKSRMDLITQQLFLVRESKGEDYLMLFDQFCSICLEYKDERINYMIEKIIGVNNEV